MRKTANADLMSAAPGRTDDLPRSGSIDDVLLDKGKEKEADHKPDYPVGDLLGGVLLALQQLLVKPQRC